MDDFFLASRSLKALPLQTAKADIAVLFPFVCYLSRFSSILRTWPMIRFTVLLGHCVMSFFQYWDLAHEVILNGKLRISSVYLQCNKSKLTKKKPRYSWPVSTGRTGQRIFFFFLHLVCPLSGVLYFELSPRKLISFFSLVQTVAALLAKLLGLFAHSLKFDRFQTLRSNSQQDETGCPNGRNM